MTNADLMQIRQLLTERGRAGRFRDGADGLRTEAAIEACLAGKELELPRECLAWPSRRQAVARLQLAAKAAGIDPGPIDGWWGPQTDYAVQALAELQATGRVRLWRDELPAAANPHGWPLEAEPALRSFYGPPGDPGAGPAPPPLKRVQSPWPLRIAWNPRQTRAHFLVHERVADSLATVLARIHAHYGPREIERLRLDVFGGDYHARKKRGGSAWSTHAWGIAIDFDPEANQLRWGRDRATLARADYDDWWRIWEAEGWVSLGRTRNYDWMHVQAARI